MSAPRPLPVGVVGCGAVVRGFHLPAAARAAGVEVVALADRDPDRLAAAADGFGVEGRFASHRELLAAADVRAVLVALPPAEQPPVAADVIEAGRALLAEKPVAVTVDAAEGLAARAEAAGVVACTAFNLRRHPYVPAARDALRAGGLGRIRAVRSTFTTATGPEALAGSWRSRPAEGGGVLHDLAVHHFDLLRHLTGSGPRELSATVGRSPGGGEAVEVAGRLPDGTRFTGRYARGDAGANELAVVGRRGALTLAFYDLDGLRIASASAGAGERARLIGERYARALRHAPTLLRGGPFRASYVRQWEAFAAFVRGERRPDGTLADGAAALRAVREAGGAAR